MPAQVPGTPGESSEILRKSSARADQSFAFIPKAPEAPVQKSLTRTKRFENRLPGPIIFLLQNLIGYRWRAGLAEIPVFAWGKFDRRLFLTGMMADSNSAAFFIRQTPRLLPGDDLPRFPGGRPC